MDGAPSEPDRSGSPVPRLRVLVADERPQPLAKMAEMARGLGHEVVAVELNVSGAAHAIREQSPDLAIVALHEDQDHALELVEELVEEGICPVIVQSNGGDP